MAVETSDQGADWVWADCRVRSEDERAYEHTLIRAVDAVRIGLVIILFLAALAISSLITNLQLFSLGLFVGALLSLWARFEADWELLRGVGQLPAGAAVLAIGDLAWLSLVIVGSGGLLSPFAGLLVIPILYSVALFCRLKTAPIMIASIAVLVYLTMAAASPQELAVVGGHLTTVVALAFLSYAVCQILERERRSSEVMMRELSEGVVLLDSTGHIVAANRQIERIAGVSVGCMVGEQTEDLRSDDRFRILSEILKDTQANDNTQEFAVREISIDGPDAVDLLCTTARLPGLVGERIGSVVVCEDVTAIKSALRVREGGNASIHSDLNSPTAVLRIASSMLGLLADGMHKQEHQRVVEALDLDARALVSNIASLMSISSLEDPGLIANVSPTDVGELVRRIRRRLSVRAVRRGVDVVEELLEELPVVSVDAPRFEDALYRLCDNALRHSPEGGRICIAAEVAESMIHLSVTDDGPGVPLRDQAAIFEKFVQFDRPGGDTQGRGLGLGLTIVRSVADLHGGDVHVRNHPDGGVTFTLSVPIESGGRARRGQQSVRPTTEMRAAAG